jgi:hypothetical protein
MSGWLSIINHKSSKCLLTNMPDMQKVHQMWELRAIKRCNFADIQIHVGICVHSIGFTWYKTRRTVVLSNIAVRHCFHDSVISDKMMSLLYENILLTHSLTHTHTLALIPVYRITINSPTDIVIQSRIFTKRRVAVDTFWTILHEIVIILWTSYKVTSYNI